MRSALAGACFGSALALAAAAGAQTLPTADAPPAAPAAAAPAAPVPATGCELHIWPTERFLSRSSGFASLLGGGLLPALIDRAIHRPGDRDNREQMRDFLDSADQTSALAVIDPQIQLFLPNYRLVPHDEPLVADQERPRTRYAASSSPCY
ncbi:MAG TPA: hypothetical protein VGX37_03855, partial [Allosphingosinicella sp.]|nr:hypothetical protein [Allosphingosinicella sp.]